MENSGDVNIKSGLIKMQLQRLQAVSTQGVVMPQPRWVERNFSTGVLGSDMEAAAPSGG